MRWQLLGCALLLIAGESAANCSPPAHLLRAIGSSERVSLLRLSGSGSGRANPLDSSGFLGFEVLESMVLPGEGAKRVAQALGKAESYSCESEIGDTDAALPIARIGLEFSSARERIRLVLFAPEQGVEMEIENGQGARVFLSAKGDYSWWEAMRPLLHPEVQRFDFYAFMTPADTRFPTLDSLDRGLDTTLELSLLPITRVPPEYPELALDLGLEGVLRVRALVGPDGQVHRAEVTQGFGILNDAAKAAVLKWRFRPPLKDGKIVWAWTTVPVHFSLD